MPTLRTAMHWLLALAVLAQGVLPSFAAASACSHREQPAAAVHDAGAPHCHDEAGARPASGDDARGDCCTAEACDCACMLVPGVPTAPATLARIDVPAWDAPRNFVPPAPASTAPLDPPPIA